MAKAYRIRCPKCEQVYKEIPHNTTVLLKGEMEDGSILIVTPAQVKDYPDVTFKKVKKHEELYGDLCSDCQVEYQMKADIVMAGGVFLECSECGKFETISKDNPVSAVLREQANMNKPDREGNYPALVAHFDTCSEHAIGVPTELQAPLE